MSIHTQVFYQSEPIWRNVKYGRHFEKIKYQKVPNEIWLTFHKVLARFARNKWYALPETLHALTEKLKGLHEKLQDSHETLNNLYDLLNGFEKTFLVRK